MEWPFLKGEIVMTELLVTPKSVEHIEQLIKLGADAFVIGEEKFGLRLAGEFKEPELREAIKLIHDHGKSIRSGKWYFHNEHIDDLESILICYMS